MLWIIFIICVLFALYSMGAAAFVALGFWQDDDGQYRWHPEFLIFILVVFVLPIWFLSNFTDVMG